MIYQITTYKDDKGRVLEVQIPHGGDMCSIGVKFVGSYIGEINGRSFHASFEIPDCMTVEEAFKRYDERAKISAQEKAKEIQQQIIKQQLAMPAKMPLQMPGRNGKLIT